MTKTITTEKRPMKRRMGRRGVDLGQLHSIPAGTG